MIVFGAGGFAKEILQVLKDNSFKKRIIFFDNLTNHNGKLFNYDIFSKEIEVKNYFEQVDNSYCIGIGDPILRSKIHQRFSKLGGICQTIISLKSNCGEYDVKIEEGVVVLSGVSISNSVSIGKGTMIYYNSIITHDCEIGDFVEISPSVNVLGRVKVGSFSRLGANCTILPDVIIGKGVTIGAGSVVTKDIPDNKKVIGIPGRIIGDVL